LREAAAEERDGDEQREHWIASVTVPKGCVRNVKGEWKHQWINCDGQKEWITRQRKTEESSEDAKKGECIPDEDEADEERV
jgi:hypothetical protein